MIPKPVVLVILDGWGDRDESAHNAIAAAHTPHWDRMLAERPHTHIATSGEAVGLPEGQMGNSEVGHLNLGSGRIVYQDYTRINQAIADGRFDDNPALGEAVDAANAAGGAVHICGLASPGGVHSHEAHIRAMIELAAARGARAIYVHAFLDGRDTPPKSAGPTLERLDAQLKETGRGRVASLVGRFYAMDRDRRFERTRRAWDLLTAGTAETRAGDPAAGLEAAYARGETDEFVQPTVIAADAEAPAAIGDGDALVFMNFRADRMRQITAAFVDDDFDGFERERRPKLSAATTLTRYRSDFDCPVAFPPEPLEDVLGEVVAERGLKQLRVAETEKYAHVTYFFNGTDRPFDGEDRELIPSPKVVTYDERPEMSAVAITDTLVAAIEAGGHDLIICNFANADMVGHTGDFDAAVRAVECVDRCLGRLRKALEAAGGAALITADHGNAERMRDEQTGQAHTAHTIGPVPLVYLGAGAVRLRDDGSLRDVAPTLLALLGLSAPAAMTGQSLIEARAEAGVAE